MKRGQIHSREDRRTKAASQDGRKEGASGSRGTSGGRSVGSEEEKEVWLFAAGRRNLSRSKASEEETLASLAPR